MSDPSALPRAEVVDDIVLPFAVEGLDVRGRAGAARAGDRSRSSPATTIRTGREAGGRGGGARRAARLVAEVERPLSAADQDATGRSTCWSSISTRPPLARLGRFDAGRSRGRRQRRAAAGDLLGQGHLAMTIDQGARHEPLSGRHRARGPETGGGGAHYFGRSEQIPTLVRLAVAERIEGGRRAWRAGGLLVQFLPDRPSGCGRRISRRATCPEGTGSRA